MQIIKILNNFFKKIFGILHIINKSYRLIFAILKKECLLSFRNFFDVLTIIIFFVLSILIFIFAIGPDNKIFTQIGVGIIWVLLLLSSNLSIKKFYEDDYKDGSIILYYISGISIEFIVILKLITSWLFFQLPFIVIIPLACLLLNIEGNKIQLLLLVFLIGSPILTSLCSISSSMNLLNDKNFAIGSIIVMLLSIPMIIFSVNIIVASEELVKPQINILLGILLFFLAVTPWVSSACIRIALREN